MKFFSAISLLLLLTPALLAQQLEEEQLEEGQLEIATGEEDPFDVYDVREDKFFPSVAVATFTGPTIIGEFSFYQDTAGQVVATGAFQKGLKQDRQYQFRFHQGADCEDLGEVMLEHEFESMHVLDLGGTPPVQEPLQEGVHLSGENGFVGLPWVLSDGVHDLACVVLKNHQV